MNNIKLINIFGFILIFVIIINCTFEEPDYTSHANIYLSLDTSRDTFSIKPVIVDSADEIELLKQIDSNKTYSEMKLEIKRIKTSLNPNKISMDSISNLFTKLLVKELIPYWYGTEWSFEGHTSKPKVGTIACGYFISTTLKHMGLYVNRYKLAQQSPINEAKSLSSNKNIIEILKNTSKECINEIRSTILKDGIYFLGFDENHVGYLYREGSELFVIHSNFIGPEGVVIEKIEESEAFSYFNHFYIAEISTNLALMKKWIKNEKVYIFFY